MNLEQNKFLRFLINPSFMKFQKNKKEKENEIMKRIKKIASLLLAMVMVFAMSVTAFANSTTDTNANKNSYTITMNGKAENHTYKAYQIFGGELSKTAGENGELKLSNIVWGDDVDGDALLTNLKAEESFATMMKDAKNARDVAEALVEGKVADNSKTAQEFADVVNKSLKSNAAGTAFTANQKTYTATVSKAGYYFIKDETENVTQGESYTDFILEVVGDTTTATKDDVVHVDKKIVDGADKVTSNKAGIGDDVTYELTSNVPDHSAYDYYFFVMNDTLSNGLDFNNDVVVKVGDKVLERGADKDYVIYDGENNEITANATSVTSKTFKIAFTNIKSYDKETAISVTYSAKINANAVIGENGNTNEVNLTYSNNPNESYDGKNIENKPGLPDTTKDVPVGTTNEIKVITFVTQVEIFKTQNGDTNPLAGAEFTLTGFSTQTVLKGGKVYTPSAEGTMWKLKDGTYTTNGPQEVATVRPAANGAKAGYVEAETDYKGTDIRIVGDKVYRPLKKTDTNKTVYVIVEPNVSEYDSTSVKYKEEDASENTKTTKFVTMTVTSDENGKVVFNGLGEGEFLITETKTPEGFNTAAPIKVVITGTVNVDKSGVISGTETCTWSKEGSSEGVEVKPIQDDTHKDEVGDQYYVNIVNNSGSLLPSTGGIGTTIFYVIGGILVIGAGILLVTKRRMKAQ